MPIKVQGLLFQQDFKSRDERDDFYYATRETHEHVSRGTEQVDNKISWWVVYGERKPTKTLVVQIQPLASKEALSGAIADIGTTLEREGEESYGVAEEGAPEELPRQNTLSSTSSSESGSLLAEG